MLGYALLDYTTKSDSSTRDFLLCGKGLAPKE